MSTEIEKKARQKIASAKYRQGKGKETQKQYYAEHKQEILERVKLYREAHRDAHRISGRKYAHSHKVQMRVNGILYHQHMKEQALSHYGNGQIACVKCGYSDIRALSIDHINGGGNQERKSEKSKNIYRFVVLNNYPAGYQTLCMNCQFVKKKENQEHRWNRGTRAMLTKQGQLVLVK